METGGLAAALGAAGLTGADLVLVADELRLGLHGQGRRVLAPKGVKVVQRVQIEYRWVYLLLGVEPRTGALRWQWLERFRPEQLIRALATWDLDAIIWDGAGAHRGKHLHDLPLKRVSLPPSSPELTPVERLVEEIRRRVEGRVSDDLGTKQPVVAAYLHELAADPARVKGLCGWDWLLEAFAQLPPRPHSCHLHA